MKKLKGLLLVLLAACSPVSLAQDDDDLFYLTVNRHYLLHQENPAWMNDIVEDAHNGTGYGFGLYLRLLGSNLLLGATWNSLTEEGSGYDIPLARLRQTQKGAALMYFFGERPGRGMFVRAEAGTAVADASYICGACPSAGIATEGTGGIYSLGFALNDALLLEYSWSRRTFADEHFRAGTAGITLFW